LLPIRQGAYSAETIRDAISRTSVQSSDSVKITTA
jgi:hypothetical protein